jgi:hypothetical protein
MDADARFWVTFSLFAILLPFYFILWASSESRRFNVRAILLALTFTGLVFELAMYLADQ